MPNYSGHYNEPRQLSWLERGLPTKTDWVRVPLGESFEAKIKWYDQSEKVNRKRSFLCRYSPSIPIMKEITGV